MSAPRLILLLALAGCSTRDRYFERKGRCEAKGDGWHYGYIETDSLRCYHIDSVSAGVPSERTTK